MQKETSKLETSVNWIKPGNFKNKKYLKNSNLKLKR